MILVAGAGGQLGHELVRRAGGSPGGKDVAPGQGAPGRRPLPLVGLARNQWDITDAEATARVLARYRPACVINAAAYTAVDQAERDAGPAYAANRDGVATLARACAAQGVPLLHVSTCHVFDGAKRSPYAETDAAAPRNAYGHSKWEGEQALRAVLPRHLILRVSGVFGAHGGNFVRAVLDRARSGQPLRVVADQTGTPTHAGGVAEALLALAARVVHGDDLPWGTWHYPGGDAVTWHAFAQEIVREAHRLELLPEAVEVAAIGSAEYGAAAARPAYSVLAGERAHTILGLPRLDWRAGLNEVLRVWKETA